MVLLAVPSLKNNREAEIPKGEVAPWLPFLDSRYLNDPEGHTKGKGGWKKYLKAEADEQ